MKKYILKKKIFAVVFLVVIFSFAIANWIYSYEPLKEYLDGLNTRKDFSIAGLEEVIDDNLLGRMNFIETYAYAQVLMDKREYNNFASIIDEDGFLHYSSFYREEDTRIFEYAMRMKRLKDYVEPNGTKVLFVVTPSKYIEGETELRTGLSANNPNATVDELLFYLNRLGVETLDLRESIPNENLKYEETFFKTDHHWTIPAAFHATCELVDKIEECFGEDLDPENYYTDIANYDIVTYKGGMLGSMGRKTGAVFCGLEDFTALWPGFEGDFYRKSYIDSSFIEQELEGSFTETFMDLDVLLDKDSPYSDSQYSLYLNGLCLYEHIVNKDNPDGPSFFMIRDSYFSPVMAFMMPMCGQIDAMWSLEETEEFDIEAYVKENRFDYIIMEIYPYNIESKAFNFFKED